jgi:hypothetical protein
MMLPAIPIGVVGVHQRRDGADLVDSSGSIRRMAFSCAVVDHDQTWMIWRDTPAPALDDEQSILTVPFADQVGQAAMFAQIRLTAFAPRLCGPV